MRRGAILTMLLLAGAGLARCGGSGSPAGPGPQPSPSASGELLSSTGLYTSIASKTIDPRNRPWVPQYVLWSDGGNKERWIQLPAGARIDTSNMDRWVFPQGTKFFKEFVYQGRRVETRLIEKTGSGVGIDNWTFKAFQWRSDESDAVLAPAAGVKDAAPTSFGTTHDIPSVEECRGCHNRGGDAINGFNALDISADRDPLAVPAGQLAPGDVTVDTLMREGLITHAPDIQPRVAASSALGRWSMGYLHSNCGNCHNPQGPSLAAQIGLDLRHTHASRREEDEPAFRSTVNVLTRIYQVDGTTLGSNSFRVVPGSPESSAVFIRLNRRGNIHQMPPFASKVVDPDAAAMVSQWIRELR